jgi:KDO2-lipid IV(A) lauroyltransferase
VGEFVHIAAMSRKEVMNYIQVSNETLENIKFIHENYRGGIIFSGHIGNWEMGPKFFLENGFNVKTVYRPLNNGAVDDMTASIRGTELISKGSKGNKQIIQEIKNGNYVVILIDQKASDGESIPFFNQNAMTSVAIARLALKYNIPLIPARAIRIGREFKFIGEIGKPIEFNKTDSITEADVINLMTKVNEKLESWIREYPAQWFWVHNRWKK